MSHDETPIISKIRVNKINNELKTDPHVTAREENELDSRL